MSTSNNNWNAVRSCRGIPFRLFVFGTALMLAGGQAFAYIGPGLGLGIIGVLVGVAAAVVLTLFGIIWYPLKRFLGRKPANESNVDPIDDTELNDAAKDPAE